MVASGLSTSPIPRSTLPPSSLNQYRFSPSGVVTTCWMRAVMDPAADFTESFDASASLTACAHSSDRNCTPTMWPPFLPLLGPGQYIHPGRRADRRSVGGARRALRGRLPGPRLEHLGIGEVADVVQEPDPPAVALHRHRVHGGAVREEEHVLLQSNEMPEVGVDHAAVGHHQDIAVPVAPQDGLHRGDHPAPELAARLAARGQAEHGLLVPELPGQLLVLRDDLLERQPLPRAHEDLAQRLVERRLHAGPRGVWLDG